ncbi:MAG: hypothetical protein LAT82_04550 [Nanoarchaeota archaeon]|nr:hypothetical protein [Nanoarchaeota archaeon]
MDILKSFRGLFFLSFLVIFGSFIFYHFTQGSYVVASYGILISFVIYVIYSMYVSIKHIKREHIELLTETIAIFSVFLFPLLAYGFVLFENSIEGILLLVLFSFMQILNFVRNWAYEVHHSKGFPVILHGLFFPLIVFVAQVLAPNFEQALFVVYFIITSMLSATPYNFIQYQGGVFDDEKENIKYKEEEREKGVHEKNNVNEVVEVSQNEKVSEVKDETIEESNDDNILLNSIPYLNKNQNAKKNNVLEDSFTDDESIDEEDEKFFNSLNKL